MRPENGVVLQKFSLYFRAARHKSIAVLYAPSNSDNRITDAVRAVTGGKLIIRERYSSVWFARSDVRPSIFCRNERRPPPSAAGGAILNERGSGKSEREEN